MAKKKTLAQRIAADPALKAKYLGNPGLRSKLPDSALTPELRKRRADQAYAKTPITPGSSVTNAALAQDIRNAQAVRYGPAETALKQQAIGTAQTGQAIGDWYGSYQRELQQHAQNTAQINAMANQANLALQQGIGQVGQAQAGQVQAGANQDAATRGATAQNLGPQEQQAQAVRGQMAQGLGSLQVATGAAASRYADTMANQVAPAQRIQAGTMNALDMRRIMGNALDVAQQKGAYGEQYKSQRVADEFKNLLAQQTLGLDATKAAAQIQSQQATAAETRRSHRAGEAVSKGNLTVAQQRAQLQQQKDAIQRQNKTGPYAPPGAGRKTKPSAGPGSLSSTQEANVISQINKVAGLLKNGQIEETDPNTGQKRLRKASPEQILAQLRSNPKIDPRIIEAGKSVWHHQGAGIGPGGVHAAHDLGVHVGSHWRIVRAKAKPKGH